MSPIAGSPTRISLRAVISRTRQGSMRVPAARNRARVGTADWPPEVSEDHHGHQCHAEDEEDLQRVLGELAERGRHALGLGGLLLVLGEVADEVLAVAAELDLLDPADGVDGRLELEQRRLHQPAAHLDAATPELAVEEVGGEPEEDDHARRGLRAGPEQQQGEAQQRDGLGPQREQPDDDLAVGHAHALTDAVDLHRHPAGGVDDVRRGEVATQQPRGGLALLSGDEAELATAAA